MNILLLNSIGKNKWGGGEKWMLLAASGLKALGHNVIIGCRSNSILESNALKADIKVVSISVNWDFDFIKIGKLRSICNDYNIEVIIGCLNKDVKIAGVMSYFFNGPLIISRQGVPQLTNRLKYKVYFKDLCHGMITNTESIKRLYDSFGWWDDKFITVIYNGFDVKKQEVEPIRFESLKRAVDEKSKIVVTAGRLSSQKGFKFFIEAAALVYKVNPGIKFFIAGEGKSRFELEQLIASYNLSNNVFLIGFVDDVRQLFKNADLFVLSSLYEGMPNVVMEAMAFGVPVISTNVNGVEELIGDQSCGVVVEPADSKALAQKIIDHFSIIDHSLQISSAKRRIEEHFTLKQMSVKLETFLNLRLNERRSKRILIIQTAFIGDVILITPLIESLYAENSSWKIDVLVRKGNESLLANNPKINSVLIFDKKNGKIKNLFKLIKLIRSNHYDDVINIQRYFTTGLITLFSGAKRKTGFDKNPLSFGFSRVVKHIMNEKSNIHEVERNLLTIEHLTKNKIIRPQLYPSLEDFDSVKRDKSYVTMAPSSVWFTKALPQHKWLELMTELPNDIDILLLGGKGDFPLCQELIELSKLKNVINCAGSFSFLQSAALMKGAKMNYVNDSGPLHLASSVDAPVRAFFCSTVKDFGFTPLSTDSKVIETTEVLSCRPCGLHGKRECPEGHFKCGEIDIKLALK